MTDIKSILDLVQVVGGPLAAIVGGPASAGLAGVVTAGRALAPILGPLLGLPAEATPDDVDKAARADPEAARTAIERVNADPIALATLTAAISREQTERLRAEIDAQKDARASMLELNKRGSGLAYMQAVVTIIVMALFGFVLVHAVVVRSLPDNQVIMLLIGTLTATFAGVVGYWIGSSRGSAEKDERMAALARGR